MTGTGACAAARRRAGFGIHATQCCEPSVHSVIYITNVTIVEPGPWCPAYSLVISFRRGTEAVTTAPTRNRLGALPPHEGSNPSLSAKINRLYDQYHPETAAKIPCHVVATELFSLIRYFSKYLRQKPDEAACGGQAVNDAKPLWNPASRKINADHNQPTDSSYGKHRDRSPVVSPARLIAGIYKSNESCRS